MPSLYLRNASLPGDWHADFKEVLLLIRIQKADKITKHHTDLFTASRQVGRKQFDQDNSEYKRTDSHHLELHQSHSRSEASKDTKWGYDQDSRDVWKGKETRGTLEGSNRRSKEKDL